MKGDSVVWHVDKTLIAPTTEFNIPYVQKAVRLIVQTQFYFWFGLSMFWCPFLFVLPNFDSGDDTVVLKCLHS